jgi:hypothetical protein
VLGGCLLLAVAMALPLVRRFPPWVDFEIVLAAWWVIWVVALSVLLYRGQPLSDDFRLGPARNWFGGLFGPRPLHESRETGWWWPSPWFTLDLEGCLVGIGLVLAVVVAVLAMWLLVEVLIPALAFVMYLLIRGMLARAVNRAHQSRGRLGLALAWGMLWATAYTAPLVALVWAAHRVHASRSLA